MNERTMDLPVPLTEEAQLQLGELLAKECVKVSELEAEKKENAASFNEELKERAVEISRLASILQAGEEVRPVKIKDQLVVEDNQVWVVRLDTGEVLEKREATSQDRQSSLPFAEED